MPVSNPVNYSNLDVSNGGYWREETKVNSDISFSVEVDRPCQLIVLNSVEIGDNQERVWFDMGLYIDEDLVAHARTPGHERRISSHHMNYIGTLQPGEKKTISSRKINHSDFNRNMLCGENSLIVIGVPLRQA